MTSLRRYFLWFFILCLVMILIVGVLAALMPTGFGGILTAIPYLFSMIFVLFLFLKKERRAPNQNERKKLTLGFTLIFWTYNILGVVGGLALFARNDPDVWQNFMLYLQQANFISLILILLLILAIPLYLITWWFYGKQAQRMAAKMYPN